MSDKHTDAKGAADFRKKPVTIQAIQWTGDNLAKVIGFTDGRLPDVKHDFAAMSWENYGDLVARDGLKIFTLEGKMSADIGDWIIKGVKGEHYPCKPDIFELTYERATEGQAQTSAAPVRPMQRYTVQELLALYDNKNGDWCAIARGVEEAYVSELEATRAALTKALFPTVAQLTDRPEGAVPEGYKMMPRNPTADHVSEAVYNINRKTNLTTVNSALVRQVYEAMIYANPATAPLPQVQSEALGAVEAYDSKDGVDHYHNDYGRGVFFTYNCMETLYRKADQQPVTPSGALADNDGGVV